MTRDGSTVGALPTAVLVDEPPIPRRVHRPVDLVRMLAVLVVLVAAVTLAALGVGTSGGLEQDLIGASNGVPNLLLRLFSWAASAGVLVMPVAVGIDLMLRSRPWQLLDAIVAAAAGGIVAVLLRELVLNGHLGAVLHALTKALPDGTRTPPLDGFLIASVAFLTVGDLGGRRFLRPLAFVFIGSATLTGFLSSGITAFALFSSLMLGWAVGLAVRFALGASSTRPPGTQVAAALLGTGLRVDALRFCDPAIGGPRHYAATGPDGILDVRVLDRDTFGSTAGRGLLRRLRLRGPSTRAPALTVRAAVEHQTLMGLALRGAAVVAPLPVAACEVGPYAALVAYRSPSGATLEEAAPVAAGEEGHPAANRDAANRVDDSEPTDESVTTHGSWLSDAQLAAAWRMLADLQRAKIAHRGLTARRILLLDQGGVGLADVGDGDIAAPDLALRLDVAQLLCTVALAVGPERAVTSAAAVLGPDPVVGSLPLLQPVALSRSTRAALRHRKGLLHALRAQALALAPEGEPVEQIQLRRLTLRTLVTVVGGAVAAYVVLTQLAQVNIGQVVSSASWTWAVAVVGFTALTFAGASLVITGAVPNRPRYVRTYLTQLAVAFSGLVAPSAIGNIALNTRYLQRSGVEPAVAGGSVGLAQAAQFCSYVVLLVLSSVLAGTGPEASFTPPPAAVVGLVIILGVLLVMLLLPIGRRLVLGRLLPIIRQVVPRVVSVFQHPRKVMALMGGALMLDMSFVAALTCATRAFGATTPIATVAVVYFAGAIVGSAVPTPGGLGGIEAALSAGLIAAGMTGSTAVSAVLLYRLSTYWLPIPFGWVSLNHLQRVRAI